MLKALVITGVLAVFFSIQLAQSLDCYYCIASGTNCTDVKEVTCNRTIADETSTLLRQFKNVSNITSDNFQCMWYNYTQINGNLTFRTEIRSCAYQEIDVCSSRARIDIVGYLWSCRSCNTNLCNRNPAAAFTPSFWTLPIVLICLMVAKYIWN